MKLFLKSHFFSKLCVPFSSSIHHSILQKPQISFRFFSSSANLEEDDEAEEEPQIKLKDFIIPEDQLIVRYTRSSGAGGQSVNKTNSKVEMRISIYGGWITQDTRSRLQELYKNYINSSGELIVTSQVERSQTANYGDAYERLREMVWRASLPVKERVKEQKPETEGNREKRLNFKKRRSDVKQSRNLRF
jgi:protein subunit release factor B